MIELDWLKKWDQYSPRSIAIKDGDTGQEYSYQDLYRLANSAAHFLKTHFQIGPGDRVVVMATNELEYVFLFFALQRLNAILVPVNFRLTQREVEHIVGDAAPKLLLFQKEFSSLVENLNQQLRPPHTLLFSGPDSFSEKIRHYQSELVPFQGEFDSPCMIIYTSGTTGFPKGAILTQKMIFWNSINTTLRLNISQSDCTVIFLPFFHTGGWNVLTTPFLHRGAKIVLLKKFDAEKILNLSSEEKATLLFGVPTTMDMMARSSSFHSVDLRSLRYAIVGGEPMPLELIKTWHQKGVSIRQGYGLTEFGPNVFSLNEEDALRKMGSIGFPNFYIETKILDDEGQEVPAGDIGELVLRGPSCMQGYWKNPEATRQTLKDGWLYTGDLVRKDSEGYFYVVGRKKDMFKSGGENVYPTEIEQVLRSMEGVREVAVIGIPDEKWGESGKAFIVADALGESAGFKDSLKAHCIKNLAKFKIPKEFTFVSALPKGDSGKILKKELYKW